MENKIVPHQANSVTTAGDSGVDFEEIKRRLVESARARRNLKTPASVQETRPGPGGEQLTYVGRDYTQVWLDENLPGWSVVDSQFWCEKIRTSQGTEVPALFSCKVTIQAFDGNGVKVTRTGVGSVGVSEKELGKMNTTDFQFKYASALSRAIRSAAGWYGAFFDLRLAEEDPEEMLLPPTEDQHKEFASLLESIPESARDAIVKKWEMQSKRSAVAFLNKLKSKLKES